MNWYHAHLPLPGVNRLSSERISSSTSKTRINTSTLFCQAMPPCLFLFKICYTGAHPISPSPCVVGSRTHPLAIPAHHGLPSWRGFKRRRRMMCGSVILCTLTLEGTRCVSECMLMEKKMQLMCPCTSA